MDRIKNYIQETIGLDININPARNNILSGMPIYLHRAYSWYELDILKHKFLVAYTEDDDEFSATSIDKQLSNVEDKLGLPVILCVNNMEFYNRRRLIERNRAFIVPNKQMYVPLLFMSFTEYKTYIKKDDFLYLQPFAQVIVIAHLLNNSHDFNIETKTFKEIAEKFQVNAINVSRAVENLVELDLVETKINGRSKSIVFKMDGEHLWNYCLEQGIFRNPMTKEYFSNELLHWNKDLLVAGDTALSKLTNMNPAYQKTYAMDLTTFKWMKKNDAFYELNQYEGNYCLQVWRYNPDFISKISKSFFNTVDPLSLYLTYEDAEDVRVQIELDELIKGLW